MVSMSNKPATGLYDPSFERDSCGFGLIANIDDEPSHFVVETAIRALARLTHRGAVAADGKTGDGCGLLIKFPEAFLRKTGTALGFDLSDRFAVGTVFLSQDDAMAAGVRSAIDDALAAFDLEVAGWREVPVDPSVCGELALRSLPRIEQVFVNAPDGMQQRHVQPGALQGPAACRKAFRRGRPDRLRGQPLGRDDQLQRHGHAGCAAGRSIRIFVTPTWRRRCACFTSDSRRTRCPSGVSRSRFRFLAHNGEINTINGAIATGPSREPTTSAPTSCLTSPISIRSSR